jgi:hypothetical protein
MGAACNSLYFLRHLNGWLKDFRILFFSIGKREKTSGKSILVANSSGSSDDSNDDEDFNVPRKLNASEKIGDTSCDKSDRKKSVGNMSILEVSDQLIVDESVEIVEEEESEKQLTRYHQFHHHMSSFSCKESFSVILRSLGLFFFRQKEIGKKLR